MPLEAAGRLIPERAPVVANIARASPVMRTVGLATRVARITVVLCDLAQELLPGSCALPPCTSRIVISATRASPSW
jgi:hypothetical protein